MTRRSGVADFGLVLVALAVSTAGCGGADDELVSTADTSTPATATSEVVVEAATSPDGEPEFCRMLDDMPPGASVTDEVTLQLFTAIEQQSADTETVAMLDGVVDDVQPLTDAIAANNGDLAQALLSLDDETRIAADKRLGQSLELWTTVMERARAECDQYSNSTKIDVEEAIAETEAAVSTTLGSQPVEAEETTSTTASEANDEPDADTTPTTAVGVVDNDGQYENAELGIRFSYPADGKWQVERIPLVGELEDPDYPGWRLDITHPDGGGYVQLAAQERSPSSDELFRLPISNDSETGDVPIGGLPGFFERSPAGESPLFGPVGDRVIYNALGSELEYTFILNYEYAEDPDGSLIAAGTKIIESIEFIGGG